MWKRYVLEAENDGNSGAGGTAGNAGAGGDATGGTGGGAAGGGSAGAGAAGGGAGGAGGTGAGTDGAAAGTGAGGSGSAGGTGAGGDGAGGTGAGAGGTPPAFGEKWRETLAKGDAKKAEKLGRYASPELVADALLSVQERISRGELRSNVPFPEKGTAEEQKAWRAEQGLPESPDKYALKLRDGLTIDPKDKPLIDGLQTKLHGVNASPAVVSAAVEFIHDLRNQVMQDRQSKDAETVQQARDALIAEMGLPEFKTNMNLVEGMFELMPQSVRDLFKTGRLADGTPLYGGNVDVFKGLADWARKINPVTALVPGAGANTANAIEDEIANIEKTMRTDRAAYNKDQKMQDRYLQLLEARDRAGVK